MDNIIIFGPSGEVFNCKYNNRYDLYTLKLCFFKDYFNGIKINSYMASDDNRDIIYDYIIGTIRYGDKVHHSMFGSGTIQGVMDDSFIIDFSGFKKTISIEFMIKNTSFRFL